VKALSGAWCAWVADNVLSGVAASEIVKALVASGVPRAMARAYVDEIRRSPVLHALAAERAKTVRRELHARLLREARRDIAIERRAKPPADEFFARYWANAEPVVLTDATRGWRLWSPADMKRLAGDAVVRVTEGRNADPDYDRNFRKHMRKTTVGAFVDRVLRAGETNDFYMVAHSAAIDRPELAPLLRRIVVDPEYFDAAAGRGSKSLWLGPKGTVTPLHHDTTNILFHQIHGRKQFLLVSPHETALADAARGFYVDVDPERPREAAKRHPWWRRVVVHRVVLEPGEALFLPAGWWHHVRALDVSISLSLLAFRRPNRLGWYRPGFAETSAPEPRPT